MKKKVVAEYLKSKGWREDKSYEARCYVKKFETTCKDNYTINTTWFFNAEKAFEKYEERIKELQEELKKKAK